MLQQSTSIRGFDVWTSIETRFGTVKVNEEGDILLDASIWSKMSKAFNKLNAFESEWSYAEKTYWRKFKCRPNRII